MAYANTFKRGEKKFLLDSTRYNEFLSLLEGKMKIDQYGRHTILNIYCDNKSAESIHKSISKPVYKEKLRLRSYGVPDDDTQVFLEIKKKYKGVVYKRRAQIDYKQAWEYLNGSGELCGSQQAREIDYLKHRMNLEPYVFIGYDRIAMYGIEDPELRITFDTNIRYRYDDLDLRNGDAGKLLYKDKIYLMEIKCAGALPIWLTDILSKEHTYPLSFSKVGKAFSNNITERKNDICLQIL